MCAFSCWVFKQAVGRAVISHTMSGWHLLYVIYIYVFMFFIYLMFCIGCVDYLAVCKPNCPLGTIKTTSLLLWIWPISWRLRWDITHRTNIWFQSPKLSTPWCRQLCPVRNIERDFGFHLTKLERQLVQNVNISSLFIAAIMTLCLDFLIPICILQTSMIIMHTGWCHG